MSIFYRSEYITPSGLISIHPFDLPQDGRHVQFLVDGPDVRNTLIYTVIDNDVKRFDNGSQLSTPIRGPERLIRYRPHSSFVLAVRMNRYLLQEDVDIPPVFVSCASGESVSLPLHAAVSADVFVKDPDRLVEDYLDGCVTDAWAAVSWALPEMLKKAAASSVADSLRCHGGENADVVLSSAASELEADVERRMCGLYPWIGLVSSITLTTDRMGELLAAVNRPFTIRMDMARKMLDAALDAYGRTPLPAEVSQLLVAYVQSRPGATEEELTRLLTNVKTLYERTTPEKFLNAAASMFPAMKGNSIKYVLP